ncbi:hypothetical protein IVB02_22205 [Bradyrhizobium sp. 166]|nr:MULTISPECIES: hypothetical protein [unclassified Bradyrhizobium]MCK1519554.1 hypothetical protein [Bradyrhizobium sp. 17]MCK1604066.1 hypothetical protein [Bradyrhizobium sp. 166]MCK1691091.1 hypothetical protein [Bradyrhizobium sp. 145]
MRRLPWLAAGAGERDAGSSPNVQPLDPAIAGDPVLYYVWRRLKARRY